VTPRPRLKTRYPGITYREGATGRTYIVSWYDMEGTKRSKHLPYGSTLEQAREFQGTLQHRKAQGESLVPTKKTVGELLDFWLDSRRPSLAPKTVEVYEWAIEKHLRPTFGAKKVTALSASDIAALIAALKGEGRKTWTVQKILTPLKAAFQIAVREGWVATSPVTKLLPHERPKGDQREMRCLRGSEISSLLTATTSTRWKALFAVLVFGGLRISEALSLTWDDVSEDSLAIGKSKTKAGVREVLLIPSVRRLLLELKLKQSSLYVVDGATNLSMGELRDAPPSSERRISEEVLRCSQELGAQRQESCGSEWDDEGGQPGLHDYEGRRVLEGGTSTGHGVGSGSIPGEGRISPSQERAKGRQPARELGVVGRGDSERTESNGRHLPPLREDIPAYVFSNRHGQPIGRREALRALRIAEEKAGIPNYTLHELRHTFASILIAQGELPTLVARQMGHADPSITLKVYSHLWEEHESVSAARDRLQTAMGGVL
jgi:integrase